MKKSNAQQVINNLTTADVNELYEIVACNMTARFNWRGVYLNLAGGAEILEDEEAEAARETYLKVCDLFDDFSDEDNPFDDWTEDAQYAKAVEIVDRALRNIKRYTKRNKTAELAALLID